MTQLPPAEAPMPEAPLPEAPLPEAPHAGDELGPAVRAAQHGDEAAFRIVYRALQPGLLRYLRVLVGDDAEDVASETWLQIARDLASFSGDWDKFRGWAATIGRHRALDHLRSVRRRPSVAAPIEQLTELAGDPGALRGGAVSGLAAPDTAAQAEESLSTSAAIALIATLPRDQAEAVLLRAVIGLDAQAAGQVLGKRAGAVRTSAYRGLRRLADLLNSDVDGAVTQTQASALKKVR
jgi:RNA polymerase sigma-70 factor (ECF subfamily)